AVRKTPYVTEKMAWLRKIVKFPVRNISHSAQLEIHEGGFACVLSNGEHTGVRRNFSIAHELGHTELYDVENWPPQPLIPPAIMGTDEVEKLCNVFAENLLIPVENVQALQEKL